MMTAMLVLQALLLTAGVRREITVMEVAGQWECVP